jgi:Leucine-rich repeat (LRR) protein
MGCLTLAAALNSIPDLKYLDLNYNNFGDVGVSALISAMPPQVNLIVLNLQGTGFANKACEALKNVLSALVSLQCLKLDFCWVGFPDLTTIMIALESLTHVDIISFGNRRQNTDDMHTLAASLLNLTSLHDLSLCFVELDDDRCLALAPAFATLKSLKRLTLHGVNENEVDGYHGLANILSKLELLERLNMSSNKMHDFTVLAPSMSKMTLLTHLDLRDNCIDAHGCRVLAHVLSGLRNLEYLDLRSNKIDNEGCRVLAPVLTSMKSLRNLDLNDNQYDVDACYVIIAALQSHQPFWRLHMKNRVNPLDIRKEACREFAVVLNQILFWTIGDHVGHNRSGCELCKHEFDPNYQQNFSS